MENNSANIVSEDCRKCGKSKRPFVAWTFVQQRANPDCARLSDTLQMIHTEGFGSLFKCLECGSLWVLDSAEQRLLAVPAKLSNLAERWFTEDFSLSETQTQRLEEIGLLGPDIYENQTEQFRAPCRIEWRNGRIAEPCVVIVGEMPPTNPSEAQIELFQEVKSIRDSDFALSREIRRISRQAREIRMGFAPTLVTADRKRSFVLNGTTDIFSYGGFQGKDLRPLRIGLKQYKDYPVVSEPQDLITFVYARGHSR